MADTDNPGEKIFGLRDLVFICLYIAGAAVSLFFFWRDLNAALTRLDEKPAGVVTRKYRAAQRRYAERILWERLKTESPIYNGDTIRTADASGVVVSLSADGGIIELGENTLVQIQVGKTGTLIDLAEGSVSASAGNAGLRIESGGVTINAAPGALVAAAIPAAAEAGGPEIRVLEGSAGIRQGSEDRIVAPGEVYSAAPPEARVAVVSPGPQAIFLNNAEGPLGIAFRWNRASLAAEDTVRLDVAEDRAFTLLTESRESSGGEETLYLPNGVYYWRA
ncbi:MAG: FecR family protein, partial [Treponema sp.]|nr:FecR family protein [Treponema sp.]